MKEVYTFGDLQDWRESGGADEPPIRLSVLGDPVAHSKSPQMHNAALRACGLAAGYARLQIHPSELERAVPLLMRNDFIGTNVTIPHKAAMLGLMDEVDEHARKIGAVNTVVIRDGKLRGYNTDGPGIVRALRAEFGVELRDLRVLILGAGGGAGRAIAVQCALEQCERLVLTNRTFAKARLLADELAPYFETPRVTAVPPDLETLRAQLPHIDLVINASASGMQNTDPSPLPAAVLPQHLLIYDTIYGAHRTALLRAADEAGIRSANGLSMLLHQGALSFEIWFDRPAPIEQMRAALLA
ncbi:MAG: shikimate dehydrogenase [Chthoniobacter sp.]|nr:shikimate dehydrogenase [Chthoniobacter sp.]